MSEEPQHWPTERVILERPDLASFAMPEDLEGLSEVGLTPVASLCEVDRFAPDECVSCLAHAMLLDLRKAAEQDERDEELIDLAEKALEEEEEERETPKLDNLLHMPDLFDRNEEPAPVAEQFASKVAELSLLVEELLEGPPIPPPNVSLADLALLTLAAEKWVKMTEVQGGWSPEQQTMLDATRDLVSRLRS